MASYSAEHKSGIFSAQTFFKKQARELSRWSLLISAEFIGREENGVTTHSMTRDIVMLLIWP